MLGSGAKYKVGDKWFVKSGCNGYKKGTIVEIVKVLGHGPDKELLIKDENEDLKNSHKVSYKKMWKKCK